MSITKVKYGEKDGKEVFLYTLDNGKGLKAEILNYGGIVKSLIYKGTDVVCGKDTLEQYLDNEGYFGALIGRNSNRLGKSKITISNKEYTLFANDGDNNLHGGKEGFDKKVWSAKSIDKDEPKLVLSYISPDGEEGFPGKAKIKVTYTLTDENALKISYEAKCDKDTVMNLTNHSYFNLNGHSSGSIDEHKLTLNALFYTPNTSECMPAGEILSVKNTAFDFTEGKTFKEAFSSDDKQIKMFGGLDHNMVLDGSGYRYIGKLVGDKTKIKMEIYTDLPGVQIYSGNAINTETVCKDGVKYPTHGAACFETQYFPNSMENSHFPSIVLKKGEKYKTTTEYKFI